MLSTKFLTRSVPSSLTKASVLGVACCLTFAVAQATDVYKYKDDKGTVLYTDKPMFLPAERMTIKTEASSIVDLNDQKDDKKSDPDAASKPAKPSAAAKRPETNQAAAKANACEKAREDYATRMNSRRLYEELPGGERKYLSDEELDAARYTAKQVMDAVCK